MTRLRQGFARHRKLRRQAAADAVGPEATTADFDKYRRLLKCWGAVVAHGAVEPHAGDLSVAAMKASKAALPLRQRYRDSALHRLVKLGQGFAGYDRDTRAAAIVTARGCLAEVDGVALEPAPALRGRLPYADDTGAAK